MHREQRDRLRRLYRAERLAAAGQLAAGVAHEIRNPLTSIRSTIQYLVPSFAAEPEKQELMGELLSEVDRINRIVNDLLSLARPSEFCAAEVELPELLEQSVLLVRTQADKQGVTIESTGSAPGLVVSADPNQLKQVFLNVLLNALQAMPDGGRLSVKLDRRPTDALGREWVHVVVADTGTGIPGEFLDKIFDPFFTLKREGTGLGLSISYNIVQQHEGEMEVQSQPGEGTTVNIRLPLFGGLRTEN